MVYGFIAAGAWGMSTIAAAKASRFAGAYTALLLSQSLGVIVLFLAVIELRPALPPLLSATAAGLVLAGLLQLAGWMAYYQAMARGPVGLVSAIAAVYGGITAILAVGVSGESIGATGAGGIALMVAGVAVAAGQSGDPGPGGPAGPAGAAGLTGPADPAAPAARGTAVRRTRSSSWGGAARLLAIASAVTYGTGAFLLGRYTGHAGWLPAALVDDAASVEALLLALPFTRRPRALWRSRRALVWAAVAGLAESAALLSFARGGLAGQMAITAAVSSLYPVIPLAAGIVLFREHLHRRQVLAAGFIIGGLVLIGMA